VPEACIEIPPELCKLFLSHPDSSGQTKSYPCAASLPAPPPIVHPIIECEEPRTLLIAQVINLRVPVSASASIRLHELERPCPTLELHVANLICESAWDM